jgi:hypothetical protein
VKNVAKEMVSELAKIAWPDDPLRTLWGVFGLHGQPMRPEALSFAEARLVVEAARAIGGLASVLPKQCYKNAQQIILNDFQNRFEYVEGFVANENLPPLDHAWLLLNGKVVDLTLRARNLKYSKSQREPDDYIGIVIARNVVRRNALRTGKYGPVVEGPFKREVLPR